MALPDGLGVAYVKGSHPHEVSFSPVNLFYVNLVIRRDKQTGREEGEIFPPGQLCDSRCLWKTMSFVVAGIATSPDMQRILIFSSPWTVSQFLLCRYCLLSCVRMADFYIRYTLITCSLLLAGPSPIDSLVKVTHTY